METKLERCGEVGRQVKGGLDPGLPRALGRETRLVVQGRALARRSPAVVGVTAASVGLDHLSGRSIPFEGRDDLPGTAGEDLQDAAGVGLDGDRDEGVAGQIAEAREAAGIADAELAPVPYAEPERLPGLGGEVDLGGGEEGVAADRGLAAKVGGPKGPVSGMIPRGA
jgi:hypothetical protein